MVKLCPGTHLHYNNAGQIRQNRCSVSGSNPEVYFCGILLKVFRAEGPIFILLAIPEEWVL